MKITAWNTEGRLTRFAEVGKRGSPEQIVEEIAQLDSDIIFLPEAYDASNMIEPAIAGSLENLNYSFFEAAYDDADNKRENAAVVKPHMLMLSRVALENVSVIRLGGIRNMIAADAIDTLTNQPIRILGIHLDDKNEHNRLRQVEDLIPLINASKQPTLALGDFNAMYKSSLPARILSSGMMSWMIKRLEKLPLAEKTDMLQRLSEMAIGSTMSEIHRATSLKNADPKSQLTMTMKTRGQEALPSIRLVKIDHILTSPSIEVLRHMVAHDGGSDHRAISVEIAIAGQNKPSVL